MVDFDEIEPAGVLIAAVVTAIMVYSMFFWNPEYWGVVPMYLRLTVAVASPLVAYFVTLKVLE